MATNVEGDRSAKVGPEIISDASDKYQGASALVSAAYDHLSRDQEGRYVLSEFGNRVLWTVLARVVDAPDALKAITKLLRLADVLQEQFASETAAAALRAIVESSNSAMRLMAAARVSEAAREAEVEFRRFEDRETAASVSALRALDREDSQDVRFGRSRSQSGLRP